MFDFAALDVALGVIFVYLVLALACSALNETISSVLSWRAKFLREGIANLLDPENNSNGRTLATQLYGHPLINSLIRPVSRKGKLRYPSYLPSRAFASALLDFDRKGASRSVDEAIAAVPSPQVRAALTTLRNSAKVKEGEEEAAAFKRAVEAWYDDAMERVSGWYRRRVQVVMWVLAAGIAFSLNVDTIRIADHLWKDKTVRSAVVARTQNPPVTTEPGDISEFSHQVDDLKELKLPIGWSIETQPEGFWDWLRRILLKGTGLILTAAALTLGAPFWFDVLGKVARIRSAGARPKEEEAKPAGQKK
jgi:hypothetical protein